MLLHTRCSACGKVSTIPADAGDTLLCSACGSLMPTPHFPAPVLAQFQSRVLYAPSTALAAPSPAPAAPKPRSHRLARSTMFLSCLALLAALGWLLYLYPPTARPKVPPPNIDWEQANRPRVLTLKAQAEDLAIAGQLLESHEKYRQLEQLAVGQTIRDPSLAAILDRARQQQDRIYAKLLTAGESNYLRTLQARAATLPAGTPQAIAPNTVPPTQPTPAASQPTLAQLPATAPTLARWTDPATRPSPAGMPVLRRAPKPDLVSDAQAVAVLDKAVAYLRGHFRAGDLAGAQGGQTSPEAAQALCAYALLQAGVSTRDPNLDAQSPFIRETLDKMRSLPMGTDTAGRAFRIAALTTLNRAEDRPVIQADLDALLRAASAGRFAGMSVPPSTSPSTAPSFSWDTYSSDLGLLGICLAADAGFDVPAGFWVSAQEHWTSTQLSTGQWPQSAAQSQPSFASTVAGLSASFIAHDYVDAPSLGLTLDQPPYPPALNRSLAFLETGDNAINVLHGKVQYLGYNLWTLQRAAQLSGHKFLGPHNYYRKLAARIVAAQFPNGAWGIKPDGPDTLIDTAYIILFLAHGRQPAILNKLRFDGPWANRPRDAANLARFISGQLQRPVTWQLATLDRDWPDWIDAPILYLSSHAGPRLKDEDLQKLRAFIDTGGLLFTQADGAGEGFNRFADDLARTLFPGQELRDLPKDHLLYTIVAKVDPKAPLKAVSNGARLLMVHSPQDISSAWQSRAEKSQRSAFDLGLNLYAYAAGPNDSRGGLTSPYIPAPDGTPLNVVRIARLKYDGNWDPEPGGWARFARFFRWETDWGLDVSFIDLADLRPGVVALAHLTAAAPFTPSPAELAAIKSYVEAGGILLIEPTGRPEYIAPLRAALLAGPFQGITPKPLASDHPILAGSLQGMSDLVQPRLRPLALGNASPDTAGPQLLRLGKGAVVLSNFDMSSGLLGTHTAGIIGYEPAYAQDLLKNLILWTPPTSGL